jgi:hypothetical protein
MPVIDPGATQALSGAAVLSPARNLGTRPSASLIEDERLWTTRTLLPLNCPESTLTRRLPDRRSRPNAAIRDGTAEDGANGGDPDHQRRRRNQIDTTKTTETEPYPIRATREKIE